MAAFTLGTASQALSAPAASRRAATNSSSGGLIYSRKLDGALGEVNKAGNTGDTRK
jgi:hypothetical protein